jgi:translocation and assembly module TamA
VVVKLTILLLILMPYRAIAEAIVTGVEEEAKDNVELMLSIKKENCKSPKWKINGLFENASQEIDEALRALGYYHATINKTLAFEKDCWKAKFDINPGPRVVVRKIDIQIAGDGHEDPAFSDMQKKLPIKQGNPLNHGEYEKAKSMIESLALETGYLQSSFSTKKLLINKQKNIADIKLVFESGNQMVFGDIELKQDVLDQEFVKKFITVKSGDVYTSEQLAKTQSALSQSGYFETVDIRSDLEHIRNQRVPVSIKLTAKKKTHYGFGVGFDTDIGPLLNANYINRRINRSGHFFTANIDLSPVLSTAEIEYSIPLENPMTDVLSFGGGLKREDTDTFKSVSALLSARHKHAYANGWRQTLFLDYVYEDYTADSDSGKTLLLVPGGSWLRSFKNNSLRPTEGYRVEFEVKGSYQNPISDVSFLQGYLSAIWLHELPLGGKFIGRTVQGATLVDSITQLPTSYRFYAGGINSVRGYDYKELGPKNASGEVEGGELLSVFSAEYEQSLFENWGIALFVDTGNAFNLGNINFQTGVGLGIRWYSPVGPLRLDFAIPLNESDSSFQIHFAAGNRI